MATALYEKAMEAAGKAEYEVVASLKGAEMEYMKAKHPFIDRESLVIVGDHVTLESGTGCVHTAPGHGDGTTIMFAKTITLNCLSLFL